MDALRAKHRRLKTMGVQPWYARYILRGAARSPSFVSVREESCIDRNFSVPAYEPVEHEVNYGELEPAPANEPTPSTSAPEKPSLILPPGSELIDVANVSTAPDDETKPRIDLPEEHAILAVGDDEHLVLCGKATPDTLSQITNMASAIGSAFYGRKLHLEELGSFVWPVFSSKGFRSQSGDVQLRAFERFLSQLNVTNKSSILVLGLDLDLKQLKEFVGLDQSHCSLVGAAVAPSDCLRDPSLKAILWRELLEARSA